MKQKDQILLDLLRQNARASISALARAMGVSRSTVQDRLSRLEDTGIIAGYTVRLGEKAEAKDVRAVVMLKVAARAQDTLVQACQTKSNINALYTVAGKYDLVANISAENTEVLDETIDWLGKQRG